MRIGSAIVPVLEASKGSDSKTSIPSNLPNNSNLSKPVACWMSVGTSPALAPSPTKSYLVFTSDRVLALLNSGTADLAKVVVEKSLALVANLKDCLNIVCR